MTELTRLVIETGTKKVFASAIDWPGWSRGAKTEAEALDTLAGYVDRYRIVTDRAGLTGIDAVVKTPQIIEHLEGGGATDFGVPEKIAAVEHEVMTESECERQISLLQATWEVFDETAQRVSEELQKGPRGGGRDRSGIVAHTLEAERSYGRQIGVRTPKGQMDVPAGLASHRSDVVDAIRAANLDQTSTKWPLRYFIRRAAWHVLDHAWEMEDKDLTEGNES